MRRGALIIALLAGLAAAPASAQAAVGSQQNGLIAFWNFLQPPGGRFNPGAIFVTDEYGLVTRQISPADDPTPSAPAFSPDGFHVAYVVPPADTANAGVWLTDLSGQNAHELAPGGWSPSWMPDGQHVVFTDGDRVLETDLQGTVTTLFTPSAPAGVDLPIRTVSVSPDGSQVALEVQMAPGTPGYAPDDIFVANIDGSRQHQLTYTGTPNGARGPRWSPDERRIVYWGNDPASVFGIFAIDSSGGAPTEIKAGATGPAYSPDGTQIVYDGLGRMNPDGTSDLGIVEGYDPSWGPLPTCATVSEHPAAYAGFDIGSCAGASAG